jgi:hypothetical protein
MQTMLAARMKSGVDARRYRFCSPSRPLRVEAATSIVALRSHRAGAQHSCCELSDHENMRRVHRNSPTFMDLGGDGRLSPLTSIEQSKCSATFSHWSSIND